MVLCENTTERNRRRPRSQGLLLEGDSRLKQVEAIIRSEFQGLLDPDATVRSSEYQVNGNPNTTWLSFLTYSLRHKFGLMTNADVKYLPLVAKLAFSDEVGFQKRDDNGRELGVLKRIVTMLKKDDSLFQKAKSTNLSFGELYKVLKSQIENEMQVEREAADSVEEHGGYRIVDVPDFDTANFYGDRSCSESKLCYTQGESTWDDWTNKGLNRAYVCLRDGWEDEPEVPTEGNPYDSYGTSMMFVFVSPDGRLVRSNCRWNHHTTGEYGPGGCDQAFTEETLARTVGKRFSTTFLPWPPEKLRAMGYVSFEDAERRVMAGEDPRDVFKWCDAFSEGYAVVGLNGRCNLIGTDGRLVSPNQWFDRCNRFSEGYAVVGLNGRCNLIGTDGRLVSPNQWFDGCDNFSEGYAAVKLNGKYNFIGTDGRLLSPSQWFEECKVFRNGYAAVGLNGKWNFIGTDGIILSKQWFVDCDNFEEGFARVRLNGKRNFIGTDGNILSDKWFDYCSTFYNGFATVKLNGKRNFIGTDGRILSKQWFDNCTDFYNGFAEVELDGKRYKIDKNGNLYDENTSQPINGKEKLDESLDEATWPDFNPHEIEKIPYFAQRVKWCEKNISPCFGQGSARMVFEIDDDRILKLAKNQKGVAQNEAEVDMSRYSDCVVQCFDCADDYSWVIEEQCVPARKSDFKRVMGITFDEFCNMVKWYYKAYAHPANSRYVYVNPERAEAMLDMFNSQDEYGFVPELIRLMGDYQLPYGDLCRISSYGMVKRDGEVMIVLIDSGLTNDVYNTYYAKSK